MRKCLLLTGGKEMGVGCPCVAPPERERDGCGLLASGEERIRRRKFLEATKKCRREEVSEMMLQP
jgi:hypothetical protein